MEISIFQHVKKIDSHLCSLSVRAVRSALQGRREALRERCRGEGERGGTARTHGPHRSSVPHRRRSLDEESYTLRAGKTFCRLPSLKTEIQASKTNPISTIMYICWAHLCILVRTCSYFCHINMKGVNKVSVMTATHPQATVPKPKIKI